MIQAWKPSLVLAACSIGVAASGARGADVLDEWTFEGIGSSLVVTDSANVGPYAAQGGSYQGSATANGHHTLATADWAAPVGNGSATGWSSNSWSVDDYYEFNAETSGYHAIVVAWDITRSNTGPVNYEVRASWDGWQSWTSLGTFTALLNGQNPMSPWNATTRVPAYGTSWDENAVAGTDNFANHSTIAFRIVCLTAGTNSAGLLRVDNFKVSGTVACDSPTINVQPAALDICEGSLASFEVSASGTTPLSYQWRRNGAPLSDDGRIIGTDAAILYISPSQAADGGNYDCVVTNACGNATSDAVALAVDVAPVISVDPIPQTACLPASATFTVSATGTPPLSYQWRNNYVPLSNAPGHISGADTASLTLSPAEIADAGDYDCVITNACGSVTSVYATLTVSAAPAITAQPSPAALCTGDTAYFHVGATGVGTYQWRRNGVPLVYSYPHLLGVDTADLYVTLIVPGDAGTYDCVITNGCASATTSPATLTIGAGPTITSNPSSQTGCIGSPVSFTVAATGTFPLTYRWVKDGSTISGAVSATYTIPSVTLGSAGAYVCVVTDACHFLSSSTATLTVSSPPTITLQPTSDATCAPGAFAFTIAATGSPAPTFQWRKGGVPIPGATGASYSGVANLSDAGSYDCVVTTTCGSVTSNAAVLTVYAPATWTSHPTSQTVCAGSPVNFTVSATGTAPLNYQWTKNGIDIPGATSTTYTITSASASDAGTYRCYVDNPQCNNGDGPSNPATLTVNTPASVVTNPSSQAVCSGQAFGFSVVAGGTPPLTYQWRKGGVPIAGATNSSYSGTASGSDAGSYDCVATNTCGSVASAAATLDVSLTPSISTQPASVSVCPGEVASLAVIANGTPVPTYQWRKNGVDILGATATFYAVYHAVPTDTGSYDCVVTNSCGSVTSSTAIMTVNAGPIITTQPTNVSVFVGSLATLSIGADGTAPLSYQWRKNGGGLIDGGAVSGALTATLTINPTAPGDSGLFDCVVTNPCGATTTDAATLTIRPCTADLDDGSGTGTPDGGTDINDLLYFLLKYEAGDLSVDLDDGSGTGTPDGGVDINDLLMFLDHYEGGC